MRTRVEFLALACLCGMLACMPAADGDLGARLVEALRPSNDPLAMNLVVAIRANLSPLMEGEADALPAEGRAYVERIYGTRVAFEMKPVPAGRFLRGSPGAEPGRAPDEGPQQTVEVEAFWMGRCEVTWEEFDVWANSLTRENLGLTNLMADAVATPSIGYVDMSLGLGRGKRPAAGMSQLAAKLYCRWLTYMTGHYYRLPTEAEWEYACRAGTTNAYSFGNDPSALADHAWFEDNSDFAPQRVGLKQANAWGLCDMHGNLAEWVLDAYTAGGYPATGSTAAAAAFAPPPALDPRCVRGGSFDDPPAQLRSAARRGSADAWRQSDPNLPKSIWWLRDAPFVGFRVVRPVRVPGAEDARRYDLDHLQQQQLVEKLGWLRLLAQ